jgi:predicted RNA-binding protein YlqC (UPF0109 family)
MKEFIMTLAKALVDNPEMVDVQEKLGNRTTVFELKVAKEDLGRIIGKNGRNAYSIRTLLNAVSTKLEKRAILDIIE